MVSYFILSFLLYVTDYSSLPPSSLLLWCPPLGSPCWAPISHTGLHPLLLAIDALLPPFGPELWLPPPTCTDSCLSLSQLLGLEQNCSGRKENRIERRGRNSLCILWSFLLPLFPICPDLAWPPHPGQLPHASFPALRAGLNLGQWHKLL